ncbi:glycosyltransferase family 4 protein [Kouleothrix sp.]|uniref:glycosyltransferase family 4 protein n=1 Tax=Kouleothrix sp. TaxID=2779161 RepID=UPI00391951C8
MRLLFLSTSSLEDPSPRGRWLPLARELAALGHQPELVMLHPTYGRLPAGQRRQERGGVVVYYAGQMHVYGPVTQRRYYGSAALLRVTLLATWRLLLAALRAHPDAIHVCKPQPMNGMAGMLAARRLGVPLYVDCDDYEAGGNRFGSPWQRALVRYWEDMLPRRAAAVTVNTRFLQSRCAELGVAPERIVYVPNGIAAARIGTPPPRQVAGLRAALGLGDAPVAVYAGTLSETSHNLGLLLDAFALVHAQLPGAKLLLVGTGPDHNALAARAHDLGLEGHALFVGHADYAMVPAYFALARCSADPVADDAVARGRSPLKIVESLAAGVPVVTGDVGDRAEMLGARGGTIVAPGSARALADGMLAYLRGAAADSNAAGFAREQAAHFRWGRLAREWLEAYR